MTGGAVSCFFVVVVFMCIAYTKGYGEVVSSRLSSFPVWKVDVAAGLGAKAADWASASLREL